MYSKNGFASVKKLVLLTLLLGILLSSYLLFRNFVTEDPLLLANQTGGGGSLQRSMTIAKTRTTGSVCQILPTNQK